MGHGSVEGVYKWCRRKQKKMSHAIRAKGLKWKITFHPTHRRGADISPLFWCFSWITEKSRSVAPRNFAWLSIHQFCVMSASGDLLPFKVRWDDPTSSHFLRLCRCARAAGDDQTFYTSRMYKVIGAYNLYISDFSYCDIRPGQFFGIPILH